MQQVAEISHKATEIPCTDPATGESLGSVRIDTPDEVRAIIARAKVAQETWGRTSFKERRRFLQALMDYLIDNAHELCEVASRDSGKTLQNSMLGEIWPICEKIRWTIKHGEKSLKPERVSSGILMHKTSRVEFVPLGVIGVICPWNFPLQNILGPTVAALMAGNAVVAKVSEWVAWSSARFQGMFDELLEAHGQSKDLVRLINGYGETGAALVSGGVGKVIFTGSVRNGHKIIEESAKTLTPVILELGGNDPMLVCDDANLEQAAHTAISGSFLTAGQMCLATERVYAFDAIHDAFVEQVVGIAEQIRQGPPLGGELVDVGAMTMPGQVDIVDRLVRDAVDKGATVRVGGGPGEGGRFYRPTVLTGVTEEMAIAQEETFGPVLSIMRVSGEEEAIERANGTDFGLSASVFTRDRKRGDRMARRLVAGSALVNDFGLAYMAQALPFGGTKSSGFGRLNGRDGLRACTNIKAIVNDRFPMTRPVKLFPVEPGDTDRVYAAIRMMYSGSFFARLRGLLDVIKGLFSKEKPSTGDQ